jgi:carboxyl-terminal processing protease
MLVFSIVSFSTESKKDYEDGMKLFCQSIKEIKDNYYKDVDFKELIYFAIDGMLENLDPHSTFMKKKDFEGLERSSTGSYGGVGMVVTIKNNVLTCISPIEDSPSARLGLKSGDQIIKINGIDTAKMRLDESVDMLRGKPGTSVKITIYRGSDQSIKEYTIVRENIKLKSVKSQKYGDIGYIRLTDYKKTSVAEIKKAIKKLQDKKVKGYILDLRNNPGGLLSSAIEVSNLFLPKGTKIVTVKGRHQTNNISYYGKQNPVLEIAPLVVLINEGSASASEITSGALRDNKRAILVGERSFGKGSVQRLYPLPDGSGIKLTIAKYYTPSDECIHGVGIQPDIVVNQKYYTDNELRLMNKVNNGKYIEDYLNDVDNKIKSIKKTTDTFEATKEGYEKLDLDTYAMNPLNIRALKNKLKGNEIRVSDNILQLLILKGLDNKKFGEENSFIIDPVMDEQLKNGINTIKTIIWQKK